jgi:hypothetical protein
VDSSESKNFSRPLSFEPLDDRRGSKEAVLQALSQMSDHEEDGILRHEEDDILRHEEDDISRHEEDAILRHEEDDVSKHEEDAILRHEEDDISRHEEEDTSRHEMPHIRLNSGHQDPFTETNEGYVPLLNDRTLPRPLTPALDVPVAIGAQGMSPYGVSNVPESSEFLLPPKLRPTPQGDSDRSGSPDRWSQGRSSASSVSRESRFQMDPFGDSRAPSSRSGSDEYDVNTQTVSEKFNIMPTDGLLLFPEDVEKDDYLHNPDPADRDRECDIWNRRGLLNIGGLAVLTLGLLVLFIGYPIMYVFPLEMAGLVLTRN